MSARNTKKKAAAAASPAAAPMDDGKAAAPVAAAAPAGAAEAKKKRNLMTEILDISISNARCQSHMKAALTPAETEVLLTEKRAALKAAKEAAKAAGRSVDEDDDVASIKEELDEITEKVVRIGGDAPIAVAALCDFVVKSAMRYAMDQTLAAEHKMVEISALHSGDPTSLDVWPLICNLPSITSYDPENEAALKAQRAAENKALKEAREAAKKAREAGEAVEEVKKAPAEPEDDDDEDHHGPSTTFHTYVDAATKAVKKGEAYSSMRVANRLREVLSQAVADLVARYSLVAKVVVLELLGVRTLNASHLQALVKSIYVSKLGVEDHPGMVAILAYVTEKVERYHAHLESEKARKWEEMDPAKKAELEAKKAAAAEAKKKRDAANAKAKAIEMAQKAKALAAAAGGV
jgi:hypothetical protein